MPTLEQALRNIPDLDSAPAPVPLAGGLSNRSWQIGIGGVAHVLRLGYGKRIAARDFPRELRAHQAAHKAGLAPAIYHADVEQEILVTEKAPGASLSATDLRQEEIIQAVARVMRRVHELPRAGEVLDLVATAQDYAAAVTIDVNNVAADVVAILVGWLDRLDVEQTSLCHNDPVAENFIRSEALVLIDWEFAADNDPMFDLAVISAHHTLRDGARRRLLGGYGIGPDDTELRRLAGWENVYRCLYWLWLAAWPNDEAPAKAELGRQFRLIQKTR